MDAPLEVVLPAQAHAAIDESVQALRNILHFVRTRKLPTVGDLDLDAAEGVRRALDELVENGVVSRFAEGPEPVYRIGPEQQLAAAYYRNTVVHFFVIACIAELSLLRAAETEHGDRLAAFWDEAMQLRDLLKFEFFFAEKEIFRGELVQELRVYDSDWEQRLRAGGEEILAMLRSFRPFSSHRVLRPFVEAYQLAADLLEQLDPSEEFDQGAFVNRCMGLGRQYHLQRRIHSAASVSQVLFRNALRLAENRGLLDASAPDLVERRRAFAAELSGVVRRVEAIDALVASRRAGLI